MGESAASTYNFLVVFVVALGSVTNGFNNSIMGTVFGLDSFYSYFKLELTGPHASYGNSMIATTQGIFYAGGIIGSAASGWVPDKFGRKRTVQMVCLICLGSVVLQTAAVDIAMLLVGRFFNGLGSGMITAAVPLYQSEVSPAKSRGRMVGTHGFLIVVGYTIAAWTGLGCYFEKNPQVQWRLCLALQAVAPLLLLAGSLFLPESPRWLVARGRRQEAFKILSRLHGTPDDPTNMHAREEFFQIERQLELDSTQSQSIIEIMKTPSYRKRFLIGLFVMCMGSSTGVLVINNYQIILYNGLGVTGYMPLLLYALYATWAAVMNLVGSLVVDRTGRVRMLSLGIAGCGIIVACEAAMVAEFSGTANKIGNGFGVSFFFVFITIYGSCVDAISYVYVSELFPTYMRARGLSLAVLGIYAMTLLYTQVATVAFEHVGWKFYLLFILTPLVGAPIIWFFPETKGLTLEEIGKLFGDEIAIDLTHMTAEERGRFDQELAGKAAPENATVGSVDYEKRATDVHNTEDTTV